MKIRGLKFELNYFAQQRFTANNGYFRKSVFLETRKENN